MEKFELTDTAILNLIKQGTVEKEVQIIDGIKITLKNLTQDDREKYSKLIKLPILSPSLNKKSDITAALKYNLQLILYLRRLSQPQYLFYLLLDTP